MTPTATRSQALETVGQVRDVLSGKMPCNALNPKHARRLAGFRARP